MLCCLRFCVRKTKTVVFLELGLDDFSILNLLIGLHVGSKKWFIKWEAIIICIKNSKCQWVMTKK